MRQNRLAHEEEGVLADEEGFWHFELPWFSYVFRFNKFAVALFHLVLFVPVLILEASEASEEGGKLDALVFCVEFCGEDSDGQVMHFALQICQNSIYGFCQSLLRNLIASILNWIRCNHNAAHVHTRNKAKDNNTSSSWGTWTDESGTESVGEASDLSSSFFGSALCARHIELLSAAFFFPFDIGITRTSIYLCVCHITSHYITTYKSNI